MKVFPTNALRNGSTYNTYEAKVFPIIFIIWKKFKNHETFLSLDFCSLQYMVYIAAHCDDVGDQTGLQESLKSVISISNSYYFIIELNITLLIWVKGQWH